MDRSLPGEAAHRDAADAGGAADRSTAAPDLRRFFAPRSVAVVGATEDLGKFGGRCFHQLRSFGFQGRIFPVNPRYTEMAGLPCYPDLTALPEAPDHVGIIVPAERTPDVLRSAAARGARFATIFTSGFAETGSERGRALQQEVRTIARQAGIRLMGPNCNGLVNFIDGFALTSTATITGPRAPAGDVGVVSHSGGVGQVNVMWRAQQAGVNVSYEVSCGNDADLDLLDYVRFMVEDPHTRVVLIVAERIPSGAKLVEVARLARRHAKPLIVLKFGRTEAGSRAAASHTGAMTGSDAVHDAAFHQLGIVRVDDCNELYETAMMLRGPHRPGGNRVAAMSLSGGNTVLMADIGAAFGLEWPSYDEATQQSVAKLFPAYGRVANPTDLTSAATTASGMFSSVMQTLVADRNVDVMIPVVTFARRNEITQIAEIARSSPKPVAVLWTGACTDDRSLDTRLFTAAGVPVFRDARPLLQAVRRAVDYTNAPSLASPTRPPGMDQGGARAVLAQGSRLTERQSKQLLACYGLPVTREVTAATAAQAASCAAAFDAPFVMKIDSPDIAHKTEAGGVRLGVTAETAAATFESIVAAARAHAPDARILGVLLQETVPPGVEMILGVSRDPVFGPVMTFGLGGIHVEVLHDVVHRLPPLGPEQAHAALDQLRARALLSGVRGAGPRDVEALCDAICRLSWLALDLADTVTEIDINPLTLLEAGRGVRVVDALVVRGNTPE